MKEIFLFIKWQWNKWELWQKFFIVGAFFFGVGINLEQPYKTYVLAIPAAIFFFCTFKWWFWDQIKLSWAAYKKEKSELFEVIKGSK